MRIKKKLKKKVYLDFGFTFDLHIILQKGRFVKLITIQSLSECEEACRSEPQCMGYFVKIDKCWLKGSFSGNDVEHSYVYYAAKCQGCTNLTMFIFLTK